MSKLEQIQTFIAVVEEGGFTAASKSLGVSAATVTRNIKLLEESLRVELLKRTSRKNSLTAVGQSYYNEVKKLISQLDHAQSIIVQNQAEPSGNLKVAATRYYAENYILPLLPKFCELYPKITLHLEIAERFPDFEKEKIDVLFAISAAVPDSQLDIVRRQILSARFLFCAAPSYLNRFGTPLSCPLRKASFRVCGF
jgi:DNA-binding transcriptional LysR family regulator